MGEKLTNRLCKKCGAIKPLMEFTYCKTCLYNRSHTCKECTSKRNKRILGEWYKKNKEQHRLNCKVWRKNNKERVSQWRKKHRETDKHKATANKSNSKYRKNNRGKVNAGKKLQRAIYSGKIIKLNICEACNERYIMKCISGHHEDYDRPLDVIWMCRKCHTLYHKASCKKSERIRVRVKKLYKEKYLEEKQNEHQRSDK